MQPHDSPRSNEITTQLRAEYQVDLFTDWGNENPDGSGPWSPGSWSFPELERLYNTVQIFGNAMGGADHFRKNLGGVTIKKSNIGSHQGEALKHLVTLSTNGTFSAWTVIHELAHAWDANYKWKLSIALVRFTGGFTSRALSRVKKHFGIWDASPQGKEEKTGRCGRLRGCNAAGYFYGGKPSGSNWNFNRKEDFAESVAMYLGWQKNNDLSARAEARINRYLLTNGARHEIFGIDNWTFYAKYFYPKDGDYTQTKRWKFVEELLLGRIKI